MKQQLERYFKEQLHKCRRGLIFGKFSTTEYGYLEVTFSIPNSPARGMFIVASEQEALDCIRYGMRSNLLFPALDPFDEPARNLAAVLFAFGIEVDDPTLLSWQTPDGTYELLVEDNICKVREGQQYMSIPSGGVHHCLRSWRGYLFENFDLKGDFFVKKQNDLLSFRPIPQPTYLHEHDPIEAHHHPIFKQFL